MSVRRNLRHPGGHHPAQTEGALARSRADLAVAGTGVAGPGGGTAAKPVGLVHFGLARRGGATVSDRVVFSGDRTAVRAATVAHALDMLLAAAQDPEASAPGRAASDTP